MPERTPTAKTPTAILISGAGSNMAALIDAAKAADYPAEIRLVRKIDFVMMPVL